jgi:hypothetical protein
VQPGQVVVVAAAGEALSMAMDIAIVEEEKEEETPDMDMDIAIVEDEGEEETSDMDVDMAMAEDKLCVMYGLAAVVMIV